MLRAVSGRAGKDHLDIVSWAEEFNIDLVRKGGGIRIGVYRLRVVLLKHQGDCLVGGYGILGVGCMWELDDYYSTLLLGYQTAPRVYSTEDIDRLRISMEAEHLVLEKLRRENECRHG